MDSQDSIAKVVADLRTLAGRNPVMTINQRIERIANRLEALRREAPAGTVPQLTQEQAIILTGYTGVMCCSSFGDFKSDLSRRVGRPVFTHETPRLARPFYRDDFLKLIPAAPSAGEPE